MKIIIVYNPKSGSALNKNELQEKCRDADIQVTSFIPIKDGFEQKLTPHIQQGAHIAVVGGDGTISSVAGLLADTKAVLIPLPGGTLNHFTKDLGIPQNLDEALAKLKSTKVRRIDIAQVNDIYFINNSSIGLYPATLHDRQESESKIGKWPAAIAAAVRAFIRFRTYTVTVSGNTFTTPFIFVGNNRYTLDTFGGTERTALNEGLLTVYIAKTHTRLTLLKVALWALAGKAKGLPEFNELHPQSLTINAKHRALSVSYDGEVSKLQTPLMYNIKAKSLKIIG